jgi:hypothetical protein
VLWGVGQAWRAAAAGGPVPCALSHADAHADAAWLEDLLESMGVRPGDVGYISYMNDQMAQYWPLFMACVSLGVPLATGMDMRFDASRLEMFLRRLPLKFVFGLSNELLLGLKATGHDLRAVLSRAAVLVAGPDTWAELEQLQLPHWKLLLLGPALAVQPPGGGGFVFDTREWQLTEDGGKLLITGAPVRAGRFERFDTGLRGRVFQVGGEWRFELERPAAA